MWENGIFWEANTLVKMFWQFTVLQCRCDLPQVKLDLIFSIINILNEMPQELPNENVVETQHGVQSLQKKNEVLATAVKNYVKA